MSYEHLPVLAKEVIEGLQIQPDGCYLDATFGRGGHSRLILSQLGPEGRLIAMDKDPEAIKEAKSGPFTDSRFRIIHASFVTLKKVAKEEKVFGKLAGILMDLGVSSPQLDDVSRGFSFLKEGPLDMRMNPEEGMDAATWINSASSQEIARVLYEYGEEKFSRRIAAAIINERKIHPFKTTKQLADLIERVVPTREQKKHPATRSFQAIRIFINKELEELSLALPQALEALKTGGRLAVISFHSLEDRIVKNFISHESKGEIFPEGLPIKHAEIKKRLRKVCGLIRANESEIKTNVRARSARLRIAEKIA